MPSTRSGSKHAVGPQHHGRHGRQQSVISNKKKCEEEFGQRRATRFQTGQSEGKRIKIGDSLPPTPTIDEIIKLERAARGANPTCLHFGIEKEVREFLCPDHYFCAHGDAYVEAMSHSPNKNAIKRNSRGFMCQGEHANFITPTTMKEDRRHWRLFAEAEEDLEAISVSEHRL
jgi:hypothetical protein